MVPPAVSDPLSLGDTVRPVAPAWLEWPGDRDLPAANVRGGVARDQAVATW